MGADDLVRFTSDALMLCLMVSLPVVVVAAASGLVIAFFQAVLSLQDASISFALKLIVVIVTLVVAAPWGAGAILQFAKTMFGAAFP
ncbi:EscS/YscS/HrcS family type III secretion system export apparatus protein [Xanthomonas hyacinthi]|uniref:EscS/YscS/HrcS family type III secretion system export apparatus protein n=1 Tax=Xanthomonas hyacinthi TaxID=56455 RepID=A0A2S7ERA0_9XANT|nr:type III secretion system export apparatus subunit SctS [Xanthomonas hyacinthi]KLD76403.1 aldolase [Xanthomonas hyacinthi DSM 19077]PPU95657.1 EscS/YscS/HrcS family type III secretion system export apparatus protein [Xanthomonas hyacinthi]QGY78067.1 EscS/YscS/HrcS family type III secretion system export apparatus protein [Xanthomonas hyacinthi]